MEPVAHRALPLVNEMNRYFWCGGKDGRLHILRCSDCGLYIHPYAARCPHCRSASVHPQAVSGRGRILSFTINHQQWLAHVPPPYIVAIVALEEQENIRLMTNLPGMRPEDVRHDMQVKVCFEQHGDIYLPLFEAAG